MNNLTDQPVHPCHRPEPLKGMGAARRDARSGQARNNHSSCSLQLAAAADPPLPSCRRAVGRRLPTRGAVLQRESSAPHGVSLFQEGPPARPRQRTTPCQPVATGEEGLGSLMDRSKYRTCLRLPTHNLAGSAHLDANSTPVLVSLPP